MSAISTHSNARQQCQPCTEPARCGGGGRSSALCRAGVYCTSGNHYATLWSAALGLSDSDGACRVSLLHYNSARDVTRVLQALEHVTSRMP